MLTNPISGSQKFFRAQNLGSVYGDQILFEYEHLPVGGQWDGFAGQTNQGVYCGGAGGVFGVKRAPTAPDWWHGGFLFPQGQATTTSRIVVTTDGGGPFGAPVPFRLIAVDAEVYANTTNIWRGIDLRNGGSNLVWTLEPAVVPAGGYPDIGQPRYTQATTGSFTNTITEIQIFNSDAGWNNRYDNFVITTNVPATP